jgi:hypothetical protein
VNPRLMVVEGRALALADRLGQEDGLLAALLRETDPAKSRAGFP